MLVVHTVGTVDKSLKAGNQTNLFGRHVGNSSVAGGENVNHFTIKVGNVYNKAVVGSLVKSVGTVVENGVVNLGGRHFKFVYLAHGILQNQHSVGNGDIGSARNSCKIFLGIIKLDHFNRSLKNHKRIVNRYAVLLINVSVSDVGRSRHGTENRKDDHNSKDCCYYSFHNCPPRDDMLTLVLYHIRK